MKKKVLWTLALVLIITITSLITKVEFRNYTFINGDEKVPSAPYIVLRFSNQNWLNAFEAITIPDRIVKTTTAAVQCFKNKGEVWVSQDTPIVLKNEKLIAADSFTTHYKKKWNLTIYFGVDIADYEFDPEAWWGITYLKTNGLTSTVNVEVINGKIIRCP